MNTSRRARGTRARGDGRRAEWIAALWLMTRGYRILGFRLRTPHGEIDLLALKGGVLAVVEVKTSARLETALAALRPVQQARLIRAATAIAARRPALAQAAIRLDLIALAPWRWPRHIRGAWRND